jgi:ATP-dependent DNA helicase RecQ
LIDASIKSSIVGIRYQIPAIVRPGVGIVISPLIALMADQVNALHLLGVKAAFLNSTH